MTTLAAPRAEKHYIQGLADLGASFSRHQPPLNVRSPPILGDCLPARKGSLSTGHCGRITRCCCRREGASDEGIPGAIMSDGFRRVD